MKIGIYHRRYLSVSSIASRTRRNTELSKYNHVLYTKDSCRTLTMMKLRLFAPFHRCGTIKHHCFSTKTDTTGSISNDSEALNGNHSYQLLLQHITHSTRSLGVWEGVDSLYSTPQQSLWESIRELPEIETVSNALKQIQQVDPLSTSSILIIHTQYKIAITALERAIQIFGSYRPGGKEQLASYALLSEFQNRYNQYESCHATLQELLSVHKSSSDSSEDMSVLDMVQIAIAKLFWYQGKHADGKAICDTLVDEERTVGVVARTGQALTRLLLVSSLDDVFSVRDPFRMSIVRLERMVNPSATVLAAAHLNMGIAEMVWAETVSKFNDVDAPLDAAMRSWKQGITILTKGELTSQLKTLPTSRMRPNTDSHLRSILHARLLSNMAYGMLHMNHHADYITRSLEYASESLAIYDAMKSNNLSSKNESAESPVLIDKEGLSRTLSILGTCYHLHGNPIMAQGLFQSALDKIPVNFTKLSADATPLQLVEQSDTYDRYADLCNDWEEREGDSKQLRQKADDINSKISPDGWKDKTSIHGSLWFWTGATILRH
jgi:hypothetical protein